MFRIALGIVLAVVGLSVSTIILLALIASPPPELSTTILIALFCVLAPLVICTGGGVWFALRAYRAREQAQKMARQRELENALLALVNARGKISLGHSMAELKMSYEEGKAAIYGLVRAKRFPGYIDWDAQMLYSADAASLGDLNCPDCGGMRQIVGKGIVKCGHCGNQGFIATT